MRFEVGEMARFVVARYPEGLPYVGQVLEIIEIDPSACDSPYYTRAADGDKGWCADFQLQKLSPPDEPVEMTRHEECEA